LPIIAVPFCDLAKKELPDPEAETIPGWCPLPDVPNHT